MTAYKQLCEQLRLRMLASIADKTTSGRAIAKKTRYSQPHVCNVLNGRRDISPEAFDYFMWAIGANLQDLQQRANAAANAAAPARKPTVFEMIPAAERNTNRRSIAKRVEFSKWREQNPHAPAYGRGITKREAETIGAARTPQFRAARRPTA